MTNTNGDTKVRMGKVETWLEVVLKKLDKIDKKLDKVCDQTTTNTTSIKYMWWLISGVIGSILALAFFVIRSVVS